MQTVTRCDYEILQVVPAAGYVAVYIQTRSEDGARYLSAEPIHLLAVVRVAEKTWEYPNNIGRPGRIVSEEPARTEVVGIDLSDGYFQVCNEACNLAGYARDGEDIHAAIGLNAEAHRLPTLDELPPLSGKN